mmetsp:Transcript_106014/g.167403  ORF Transcript_106014/g.167403 Transcript_106014/m.167403 type:complete len:214 (-) Transcript_106014:14-655(-)
MPLSDVQVAIGVAQCTLAMHLAMIPRPLEVLAILEKARALPVPPVVHPTTDIELPQFLRLADRNPEGAFAIALSIPPLTLVLVAVGEDLNSITVLSVVGPFAMVACAELSSASVLTILSHDSLSDPIYGATLPCFVSLRIMMLPKRFGLRLPSTRVPAKTVTIVNSSIARLQRRSLIAIGWHLQGHAERHCFYPSSSNLAQVAKAPPPWRSAF